MGQAVTVLSQAASGETQAGGWGNLSMSLALCAAWKWSYKELRPPSPKFMC